MNEQQGLRELTNIYAVYRVAGKENKYLEEFLNSHSNSIRRENKGYWLDPYTKTYIDQLRDSL